MLENRHFWNLILSPSELMIFLVLSADLVSKPLDFSQVIDTVVELDRPENRTLWKIPTDLTAS